ncbi:MAG: adenylyltransferase/cytidyltransferase family protein [Patescibacteria group bacterium]
MIKVMVFGVFDIVHMGHIHMFKKAKEYGDYLIVSVARDQNVEKIKGIGSFHSENERKEFLENFRDIDEVLLGDLSDPYKNIDLVKPDIIALGYDQKFFVDELEKKISEFGLKTQIVRIPPYNDNKYKSSKIKKYIEKII